MTVLLASCGASTGLLVGDPAPVAAESSEPSPGSTPSSNAAAGSTTASTQLVQGQVTFFASGADWMSYADDSTDGVVEIGPARPVCAQRLGCRRLPARCACLRLPGRPLADARRGGARSGMDWRGDASLTEVVDLQTATFAKTFVLGRGPSGSILIAADDYAEVRVNGARVGSVGSVTASSPGGFSQLVAMDLGPDLREGSNSIVVVAKNGPASFTGGACSPCTLTGNPAGVVLGGVLRSQ